MSGTVRPHTGVDREATPGAQAVLPLLELEKACGELPPLSALLGITSRGVPLLVDLLRPETGHIFVVGPGGVGKSTLLRTAMASICLHSSPSQVGLFAVDLSGVQLSVLEAIPHRLAAPAREVDEAGQLLTWFEREAEDRLERGIQSPALILLIDDLDWVTDPDQAQSLQSLKIILRIGIATGVHVLAGGSRLPEFLDGPDADGFVLAVPGAGGWVSSPGDFMFKASGWQASAQVAFLSALDLNRLVVSLRGEVRALHGPSVALAVRKMLTLEAVE
ncbi:MAG: FtsK/SpoIIIE domain-containing protein [Anaerolineales bacterium]